jgi:hypothetical protein
MGTWGLMTIDASSEGEAMEKVRCRIADKKRITFMDVTADWAMPHHEMSCLEFLDEFKKIIEK